MFRSTEIRWFFKEPVGTIESWFDRRGVNFSNSPGRVDHYLIANLLNGMGIKLREGRVEIKQRMREPQKVTLASNLEGYLAEWVKWSFSLNPMDRQAAEIFHGTEKEWVGVSKYRLGLILSTDGQNGKLRYHALEEFIESGCQIEYSRLTIGGRQAFTFCLEWFGPQRIEVPEDFLEGIFSERKLLAEHSMAYPEFLGSWVEEAGLSQ